MPTAGWPMLLHDPLHSGQAAGFGPAAFESAWSAAGLGAFGGVAVGGDGKLFFGSANGSAYCYDGEGNRVWAYAGKNPFLVNPPALAADGGLVYFADGDVVALDPTTGAPAWTYVRPSPTTLIAAPLTVDDEGHVYVSTTTASGQPNELLAIKDGTLLWSVPLPRPSTSTPAIAVDGTVYLGCADGVFRALEPGSGKLKWSWSEAGASLPMAPAVGPDGTVYVGVQGYPQANNALVALTPPTAGGTTPTVRWRYSPSPGEYLSGRGAPALAPDGTVYVGFEALHAIDPAAGTKLWASSATPTETSPGPPAVAVDGTVHFVTAAGTLWALGPDGTVRWQTAAGTAAPAAPPALAGAVYFGDGVEKLTASTVAAPLSPRLTAFYQELLAARQSAGQGRWSYTLSAQTITDAPLLALVTTATGATGTVTVVGPDLEVTDGALTLSGSASFLGVPTSAEFVFAMAGETEVTLAATATVGSALKLSQPFPALAKTVFEGIAFEGATLGQVGTTGQLAATGWALAGSVEPGAAGSPLAQTASILGITGKVALAAGATITLAGAVPVLALPFAGTWPVNLVGGMPFQCGLRLETSIVDTRTGSLLAAILITSKLTVAGQPLAVSAEMPTTPGAMVVLQAEPAPAEQPQVKLTDLNLWHGPQTDLTAAVPEGKMQEPTQTFGLEWIAIGFLTDLTVAAVSFRLGAPDWQVLSAEGVGIDLKVEEVGIEVTCSDPFGEPAVYAALGGTITTTIHTATGGSTAAFEIGAVAPDFQLYGKLVEGTEVRLEDVVSGIAGTSVTLPSGVPKLVLEELALYSQPQYGTFDFEAGGDLGWTLFEIGSVKFGLGRFAVGLERVQALPDLSKPAISASLQGTLELGDFEFEVGGYSPAGSEGWQLEGNLGAPVALPTIGDLVEGFNPAWATALPTAVANAGQDIVLKVLQFEIEPAPATKRSLQATIGTAADWAGWTVIGSPKLALTAVDVDMTAASDTGFDGRIRGGFALGAGTIAVAVPLPFSSGKFTLAYDSGNEGLTLPSIGEIANWIEPAWTLPAEVGSIGSGLSLDRFTFTLTVENDEGTIDVFAAALDQSHRWVLVGGSPQPLLALEKVTVEFHDAKTSSGAIAGTVVIGSGALPLRVAMQDSWTSYTIGLDTTTKPVTLPTLHDLVSLLSTTFADALPEPMRSWGSGIQVTRFQVAISTTPTTTATIEAAAGEPANSPAWAPIPPLAAFKLQALAVQVSGTVGALPEVGVLGTIVIGAHGRIPLKAGFTSQMKKVAVELNPAGGGATLPTVGDVAELFVGGWAGKLPSAIADLGESFSFQKLDLEYDGSATPAVWAVEIAIGTAPAWVYEPIPAFPSLKFTSISIGFEVSSTESATGVLKSTVQVMGRPVTFELQVPQLVFEATLDTGLTLYALAEYVIGSSIVLPSWLKGLGLPEIELEANFETKIYLLRAVLAIEIPMPVGKLEKAALSGEIGGPGDPRVCFEATWVTPTGAKVPGRICYPFEDFFPEADPEEPIEDFPPEEPPSDPPTYDETVDLIERLTGEGGASAGEAASIAYWSYGAAAAATVGALLAAGIGLAAAAAAMKESRPDVSTPVKLAEALVAGARLAGRTITAAELGHAVAVAFPGLDVAELVAALAAGLPAIAFRQMVEGLKGGGFQPHQITTALRTRYTATAATMVAELQGGWAPVAITAAEMVAALATASYTPVEAAPLIKTSYPTDTATGAAFARLFLAAGFTPALEAGGMAAALRAASFSALEAATGLLAAYPALTRPLDTVPFLREAGYTAAEVAPVILSELKTAAEMAKALAAAGYTAPQGAPALKAGYPTEITGPDALFTVLAGAWTGLSAADAAAASASAGYEPAPTAKALHASPTLGSSVTTAATMTAVLKGAYPAIALNELLAALAGVPFPAFAAAGAAIPAGTPVTTAVATLSAASAYPNLEPLMLAAALAAAHYVVAEVETGLAAKWATLPTVAKQRAAAAVTSAEFAPALAAVATAQAAGKTAAEAARERVVAQPTLSSDGLAAAIQSVYPFGAPALEGLAKAIVPAFTQPAEPAPLALTLLTAAPTSGPAALAAALLGGFAATPALPAPGAAAKALAAALTTFGAPTTEGPLAAALVDGYAQAGTPLKPGELASALRGTFPATTVAKVVAALKGAYQDPFILPPAAASATAAAFAISKDEPLELVAAIAGAYGLEECPVDTGAISLAMKVAGMDVEDVSGAFRQILRNWTVQQYGLLVQIYQEESWTDAWLAASGGEAVPQATESLHQQYPAAETGALLAWLVAGYDLTAPLAAATPIATGLKQIGVTEAAALAAFQAFFGSGWTAAAAAAVHAVYNPSIHEEGVPMVSSEQEAQIQALAAAAPDLPTAAWGCKNGGFTALECLPELQKRFPTEAIGAFASVAVSAWACEASKASVEAALTACGVWSSTEVAAATAANLHLVWQDLARFDEGGNPTTLREVGLFQGDLTAMASAETVSILVISALPGDLSPTPGSMIGALAAKGVSVEALSKNPAHDLRSQYKCWLSQPIPAQSFGQILVLETTGMEATANIPDVFSAIAAALPSPPDNLTVATSMLSTGSAGAQPTAILTALFNAAKASMEGGYKLTGLKVVVFEQAWVSELVTKFDQLKGS